MVLESLGAFLAEILIFRVFGAAHYCEFTFDKEDGKNDAGIELVHTRRHQCYLFCQIM